jgi:hypothetical protein
LEKEDQQMGWHNVQTGFEEAGAEVKLVLNDTLSPTHFIEHSEMTIRTEESETFVTDL